MDKHFFFVVLIVILCIFLIQKYTRLIIISILIIIFYMLFNYNFTSPRDFIYWITNIIKTINNPNSSGGSGGSGSGHTSGGHTSGGHTSGGHTSGGIIESINSYLSPDIKPNASILNNYYLSKTMIISIQENDITINDIILHIPLLLDYKLYLDDIIQFIINYFSNASNSIPSITQNDIAYTIKSKMVNIFKMAYITITNNSYTSHSYNELLYAETEFTDALNMFDFLSLSTTNTYTIGIFKKRIIDLNNKLNQYIIDKVNNLAFTQSHNITTSILPQLNEPVGFVI